MSHVIRIPDQIFKRLKDLAEPFTDTPATVIEKLLDFYEKNPNKALINSNKEPEQAKELNYDYREFKAHKPPNLKHTKVEKVILGTLPPSYKTNWNKLVQDIHRLAMERAKSFDALQLVTNFNIKQENKNADLWQDKFIQEAFILAKCNHPNAFLSFLIFEFYLSFHQVQFLLFYTNIQ